MFYLIETPDQFAEIRDILTDKCYIDYVLGNDNTHPALAEVIAIYVSSLDRKGFILPLNHPECINLNISSTPLNFNVKELTVNTQRLKNQSQNLKAPEVKGGSQY